MHIYNSVMFKMWTHLLGVFETILKMILSVSWWQMWIKTPLADFLELDNFTKKTKNLVLLLKYQHQLCTIFSSGWFQPWLNAFINSTQLNSISWQFLCVYHFYYHTNTRRELVLLLGCPYIAICTLYANNGTW